MNCQACGRPSAEGELVQLVDRWVCADCKPTAVQQLREGCVPSMPDVMPASFGEGILGYGELVRITWQIIRQDWRAILGLMLIVAVPINLILKSISPDYDLLTEDEIWREAGREFRRGRGLEAWIGIIASLGICKIVSERVQGRRLGLRGSLVHAFGRYWAAVWTGIIEHFLVFVLFLLLLVPGIMWSGYYTFSVAAVSLAGLSGKRALDASKALVKGRWWAVVGRALALLFIPFVPSCLIYVGFGESSLSENKGLEFAVAVFFDVCFAFTTVGIAVLFLNLRSIQAGQEAAPTTAALSS